MIRILLADDHTALREGLKMLIYTIIAHSLIDEAWNKESVLQKIKETKYHIIILDTNMNGKESYELVTDIIVVVPDANILILGMYPSAIKEKKYINVGAKGYISKTASAEVIKNAIKSSTTPPYSISPD